MSDFDKFPDEGRADLPQTNQDNAYFEPSAKELVFGDSGRQLANEVAQAQRSLIAETMPVAQKHLLNKSSQPAAIEEAKQGAHDSSFDLGYRMLASVGAGHLTHAAMCMSGLRFVPKIGLPLTIVAPFIAAGVTNSYLKTNTFSNTRSLAEGALAYGILGGLGRAGNQFLLEAEMRSVYAPKTISTPIMSLSSDMVRRATVGAF